MVGSNKQVDLRAEWVWESDDKAAAIPEAGNGGGGGGYLYHGGVRAGKTLLSPISQLKDERTCWSSSRGPSRAPRTPDYSSERLELHAI